MISYPVLVSKKKLDRDENESIWNLLQKTFSIPKEFEYQVIEVTGDYICRPDLISIHLYDTPNYADILCKLNGISNPLELNSGMYLIVPVAADISQFYLNEIEDNKDNSTITSNKSTKQESVKNLQKKKNETRKANEQIIGNSNFRIDRNNKIVIY